MAAKAAAPKDSAKKKNPLENPLLKRILTPVLEAVLPKVREKIGRRPLVAIGGGAAALIGAVQALAQYGVTLPPKVTTGLSIAVGIASLLVGQKTVTPVADPRLTAAQAAKIKLVGAKK